MDKENSKDINRKEVKRNIIAAVFFVIAAAVTVVCFKCFGASSWAPVSFAVTVVSVILFFAAYERKKDGVSALVLTSVMTAISVAGRVIFSPLAGIKPVAALAVITGIYLGPESGFVCGALSAFISNIFFGQGPWTPFQMLSFGIIGFVAGALYRPLKKSKILLVLYGAVSGVLYSLVMDLWSTVWEGGGFEPERFILKLSTSLPFMALYAISNAVFLIILIFPFDKLFARLKKKYSIGR